MIAKPALQCTSWYRLDVSHRSPMRLPLGTRFRLLFVHCSCVGKFLDLCSLFGAVVLYVCTRLSPISSMCTKFVDELQFIVDVPAVNHETVDLQGPAAFTMMMMVVAQPRSGLTLMTTAASPRIFSSDGAEG